MWICCSYNDIVVEIIKRTGVKMSKKFKTKYQEGNVRDVSESFYKKAKAAKILKDFEQNKIIVAPEWPKFPDYDYTRLMRMAFKMIEELNDLDIPFNGVGIGLDFNKPMFVVYLPRESRGEPVPTEFDGLKVAPVIQGKFCFA